MTTRLPLLALALAMLAVPAVADEVERGAYLVAAGGCVGCHTVEDGEDADYLAGGRALASPFGTFYAPNITPDVETGIGGFSDEDFLRAFREGVAPDGRHYYPAFPYTSYTGIRDQDLLAIKAYLDSVAPVRRENRAHELAWYASMRWSLGPWKTLFFKPGEFVADPDRDEQWNRGAYLVRHLGHCGECHSPRNAIGVVDASRELAGNANGADGESVPNITPHDSGIGSWSSGDLSDLLEIGMYPDGDFVGGSMTEVVDHGTARLTADDRAAIIAYLQALPPLPDASE